MSHHSPGSSQIKARKSAIRSTRHKYFQVQTSLGMRLSLFLLPRFFLVQARDAKSSRQFLFDLLKFDLAMA